MPASCSRPSLSNMPACPLRSLSQVAPAAARAAASCLGKVIGHKSRQGNAIAHQLHLGHLSRQKQVLTFDSRSEHRSLPSHSFNPAREMQYPTSCTSHSINHVWHCKTPPFQPEIRVLANKTFRLKMQICDPGGKQLMTAHFPTGTHSISSEQAWMSS